MSVAVIKIYNESNVRVARVEVPAPPVRVVRVGVQGAAGVDGETFVPSSGTRYTHFIGDDSIETLISDSKVALPLVPTVRTIEKGLAGWWNNSASRITPSAVWNIFLFRLTVLVKVVSPATVPFLIAEINNATDLQAVRIIAGERQPVTSGSFEEVSFNFEVYAGNNLFANGAKITLRAFGGDCVIKDPRLLIKEG